MNKTKWPEHENPSPEHAAKAPYNFVPLPETIVAVDAQSLPDQDRYYPQPGHYSGWIDCELTTGSPLYVRAALEEDEFERAQDKKAEEARPWKDQARNKPDFFYTQDRLQPVIPGSSLRGMLRALVEIASYSKVQWVTDRQLVYRAVGDPTSHGEEYRSRIMHYDGMGANRKGRSCHQYTPLVQAGYMERDARGDWQIRPAQEIGGTSYARIHKDKIPRGLARVPGCRNAERIYIEPGPYEYQDVRGGFISVRASVGKRASAGPGPGLVEGTLARSGRMFSKQTEAVVFMPDKAADPMRVSDELLQAYREQISKEQQSLLGSDGVLNEGQPVFYLVEDGKLVFFGHTRMMRLPYRKSPRDLVPKQLRRDEAVDLAEAIFGYTKDAGEGKERAYAGRVFVGDASLKPGQRDVWLKQEVVPRILASPKPTTFQHYLVQEEPDPRQVGETRDGKPKYQKFLADYAAETVIRGHKLYWHKGNVGVGDIEEEDAESKHDSQHTQVRPVRTGVAFQFQIRFENLSPVELGAILWVLDRAQDDAYRLKLGMGKPYGLGAVSLAPALHVVDRPRRYGELFIDSGWADGAQEAAQQAAPGAAGTWAQAVDSFERFIVGALGEGGKDLEQLHRIQILLTLLSWPGPDARETRYLEIEHPDPRARRGKVNEYRDRPVLPDPLMVAGVPRDASTTTRGGPGDIPAGYKRGRVKNFGMGRNRSFGFIIPEGGGGDVFVHESNLAEGVPPLHPGQEVAFRVVKGRKGWQAEDVRPV